MWGFRNGFASELGSDLEPASMLEHFPLLLFLKFLTSKVSFGYFEGEKVNHTHPTPLPSRQAFPAVSEHGWAGGWTLGWGTHRCDLLSLWLCPAAALWPL